MKLRKSGIIAMTMWLCSCATFYPLPRTRVWKEGEPKAKYHEQIRDWQQRVKSEGWIYGTKKTKFYKQIEGWERLVQEKGWTKETLDEIILTCKWRYSRYRLEKPEDVPKDYRWPDDYWKTPLDMINDNFKGDCEDIAGFFFGVLKRLKYPHEVRIRGMRYILGDHALIRVKLLDGKWKTYEVLKNPLAFLDRLYTIEEWDENNIWIYKHEEQKYELKQIKLEEIKEDKK